MTIKEIIAKGSALTLALTISAVPAYAAAGDKDQSISIIDIAGHEVPVPKGGLYDRYRSNPPLSVIAQEAPDIDLSWFETIKKEKVYAGFETYSPNFYYKNSRITGVFTADLDRLKALMPQAILEAVEPLQILPGRGLVALTAYAYHYCDNDSYNEIALSIITSEPGESSWGPFTLIGQSASKDYWGYVLKLPVDTELARVRGVVGYNLPKWLTSITYTQDADAISFEIIDSNTGKTDLVITGEKLDDLSRGEELVTNSFTNLDAHGQLISGYAVSRQLSYASTMDDDAMTLTLSDGSLSQYLQSLDLGEMVKYEYVPDFQSALYTPKPLNIQ